MHDPIQAPAGGGRAAALAAPWSLDLRSWNFNWSAEARRIAAVGPSISPTLWQALAFIDPQDLPRLLSQVNASVRRGKPFSMELGIFTAQGARRRVQLTGCMLTDDARRPRLLEGKVRLVAEPEAAGAEAPEAELRAALADWELFARAVPHELKAPLAVIEGFATALHERESGALSERGRLHLERIRKTAAHARSLGEALLLLAPLSLQAMRREQVDLSALAWQFIDLQRIMEPERQVEVDIQPGLSTLGDPDLLRSLMANLLGNAWKFTRPREPARIEFGLVSIGAEQPAFCVSDNGVGFDMEHAGDLFSPFSRLHGRSEFEGSGVGLVIARRIVERHAGSIWVHSTEGQGTRLYFVLDGEGRGAGGSGGDPGQRHDGGERIECR
jgi:signal transduction histidine kinase